MKRVLAPMAVCWCAVDPRYFRPAEVDHLLGDSSKAHRELGWKPTVSFEQLAKMMVASDMQIESEGIEH